MGDTQCLCCMCFTSGSFHCENSCENNWRVNNLSNDLCFFNTVCFILVIYLNEFKNYIPDCGELQYLSEHIRIINNGLNLYFILKLNTSSVVRRKEMYVFFCLFLIFFFFFIFFFFLWTYLGTVEIIKYFVLVLLINDN